MGLEPYWVLPCKWALLSGHDYTILNCARTMSNSKAHKYLGISYQVHILKSQSLKSLLYFSNWLHL